MSWESKRRSRAMSANTPFRRAPSNADWWPNQFEDRHPPSHFRQVPTRWGAGLPWRGLRSSSAWDASSRISTP